MCDLLKQKRYKAGLGARSSIWTRGVLLGDNVVRNVPVLIALGALLFIVGGHAQSDPKPITFAVVSVKPTEPGARGGFRYLPSGDAILRGVNLRLLLQQAYDVRDFQIIGGPSWIASDRYDITAKTDPNDGTKSHPGAMRFRLQSLLTDRFHLQLHSESRVMARYELVVAKDGPKLRENAPPMPEGRMAWGAGLLKGDQVDIRFMTVWLSRLIGQPVADQTGLKSTYDFELRWSADASPSRRTVELDSDAANDSGPSIFTAIHEQLGLKLDPRNGPVEVLVIDHIEKPSSD